MLYSIYPNRIVFCGRFGEVSLKSVQNCGSLVLLIVAISRDLNMSVICALGLIGFESGFSVMRSKKLAHVRRDVLASGHGF